MPSRGRSFAWTAAARTKNASTVRDAKSVIEKGIIPTSRSTRNDAAVIPAGRRSRTPRHNPRSHQELDFLCRRFGSFFVLNRSLLFFSLRPHAGISRGSLFPPSPLVPLRRLRGAETDLAFRWTGLCDQVLAARGTVPRAVVPADLLRAGPPLSLPPTKWGLINRLVILQPGPSCKAPRPLEGRSRSLRHPADRMLDSQANRLCFGGRL